MKLIVNSPFVCGGKSYDPSQPPVTDPAEVKAILEGEGVFYVTKLPDDPKPASTVAPTK
jgi:hypothetical protein